MEKEGMLKKAISLGLVSTTIGRQKLIYETYLKIRQKVNTYKLAVEHTAMESNCSSRHVERIIYDFKSS